MVFWASLGLILGALGALLGALLVFLRAFGSTLHAQNFFLDSLPGQIYCSFSYLLSLPSSKPLFSSSWSLSVSILNSQTDPPTLQNVDLLRGILTFLKNQRFRSKYGFESVLGLSRASKNAIRHLQHMEIFDKNPIRHPIRHGAQGCGPVQK